jgi:hypothetical protein
MTSTTNEDFINFLLPIPTDTEIADQESVININRFRAQGFWAGLFLCIESKGDLVGTIIIDPQCWSLMRLLMLKSPSGGDLRASALKDIRTLRLCGRLWTAEIFMSTDKPDVISLYKENDDDAATFRKSYPTLFGYIL